MRAAQQKICAIVAIVTVLMFDSGTNLYAAKPRPETHPIFSVDSMQQLNRLEKDADKLHGEIKDFVGRSEKINPTPKEIAAYRSRVIVLHRNYPSLYSQMLRDLQHYAQAHPENPQCNEAVQGLRADPPNFGEILEQISAAPRTDAPIQSQLLQLLMDASVGGLTGIGGTMLRLHGVAAFGCLVPAALPAFSAAPAATPQAAP